MKVLRIIYYSAYHRRRRKYYLFLLLFIILIVTPYTFYWCVEINAYNSDIKIFKRDVEKFRHETQNDDLERVHPILAKYIQSPYNINVWSIIREANRKYERNKSTYLVYSCPFMCGGWGDRTRKIVAAFLLSLALNRTFIIDMTWPCSIEHILTSNFISWSKSSHDHIRNISSSINISSLSVNNYKILKSYHEEYSVLYIQTNNIAYFDLIARYPELYKSLFNRFRLKQEHIHIITLYPLFYELLIKLKPHLQEKFDRLNFHKYPQDMNLDDDSPLLCGHLRIGRNPSNPKDVAFPHRESMNTTVLKFLLSRPGRVFITTDSGEVQQLARKLFATKNNEPSRLIEINGTIAHIDRDWNYLGCESLEKTILDFHALSYCHLAVISKSSFGHLAAMRRINPYEELYLYCEGIKKINNADDYNSYKYSTC